MTTGFKICYALSQGIVSCKPEHDSAGNKKITGVKKKKKLNLWEVVATE